MSNGKVSSIIAVRAGSKRVPNKNFKKFNEKSLLEYKIETLKAAKNIDEIIINSDSDEAERIALENNVIFQKRDEEYASDTISGSDFFKYLSTCTTCEYIVYSPVTSPMITSTKIDELIEEFLSIEGYDSVNTCSLIKEFMWIDEKPLNYSAENAPNSQDLPDILALNFAFNMIRSTSLFDNKNIVGKKPLLKVIDEMSAVDIDTPLDFKFAEFLHKEYKI